LKETAKTLPAGYSYEFSGMSREEIAAGSQQTTIFAISIIFVFLFLAALYESWSVPFSVLFAVPIGAFGSILTLTFIPSLTNNIYAQIGLITLIGLAAKNAILIVEFAKERVDLGMDIVAATLQAVQLRLRPIIMTSMAFILGVLPLAFASGAAAESPPARGAGRGRAFAGRASCAPSARGKNRFRPRSVGSGIDPGIFAIFSGGRGADVPRRSTAAHPRFGDA
jgi:multidrug efflux pump subunit AcrB